MQSPSACVTPHLKVPGRDQPQRVQLVNNLDSMLASGGREETGFFVGCVTAKADADQISLVHQLHAPETRFSPDQYRQL